jgi:hypothetical protein
LFLLVSGLCCNGFDAAQPATVRVRVLDFTNAPVKDLSLLLTDAPSPSGTRRAFTNRTDSTGWAEFRMSPPGPDASGPTWRATLEASDADDFPGALTLTLFPDAQIEQEITLRSRVATNASTMVIRLLDPAGQPLTCTLGWILFRRPPTPPNVIESWRGITDEDGKLCFRLGPTDGLLQLHFDAFEIHVEPAPEVVVTLNDEQVARLPVRRELSGTLLLDDGRPATGWFVADGVQSGNLYNTGRLPTELWSVAPKLRRVGADGTFRLERLGQAIVFVSPDGLPFRYPVNTSAWLPGVRELTVRLPAIRRVHEGRLCLADQTPAANQTVGADGGRSGSVAWSLNIGDPLKLEWLRLSEASAEEGYRFPLFQTDGEGRFAVPIFFGTRHTYKAACGPTQPDDICAGPYAWVRRNWKQEPVERKELLFRFRDEGGDLIPNMQLASYDAFDGSNRVSSVFATDSRGCHLFVPVGATAASITTRHTAWNPYQTTLSLTGTNDAVFDLVLKEPLRCKPLSGRVVDPRGKPVSNALISLCRRETAFDPPMLNALGYSTRTDASGRFRFDAAPDECVVSVMLTAADFITSLLPGWTEPPRVTRANRQVEITLQPSGSVRVLLPPDLPFEPRPCFLEGEPGRPLTFLRYQPLSRALEAPFVPPGRYLLKSQEQRTRYELGGLQNVTVAVEANKTTVVDLRPATQPTQVAARCWMEIAVAREDKPVSGAILTVFPLGADADQPVARDLTDGNGQARFRATVGRRYVAVARDPGRLVGWQSFEANPPGRVRVAMRRARTLAVTLNPGTKFDTTQADPRTVFLQASDLPPGEQASLWLALGLCDSAYSARDCGTVPHDAGFTHVAEDLPVDLRYRVQVRHYNQVLAQRDIALKDEPDSIHREEIESIVPR